MAKLTCFGHADSGKSCNRLRRKAQRRVVKKAEGLGAYNAEIMGLSAWKEICDDSQSNLQGYRGGVAPVELGVGARLDGGRRPLPTVGAEVRLESWESFFRREARRPRMLDTTRGVLAIHSTIHRIRKKQLDSEVTHV